MIGRRLIFFDKPLQRSNLCASHRQRRWLTHGELPAMRSLYNQVERMNLDVETLAPVHGRPVPWSEFVTALTSLSRAN